MNVKWSLVRVQFPATDRCIYLNTGWSGPSSRVVVTAMQDRAAREAYEGPTSPDVRYEKGMLVRRVRHAIASMIGAEDEEVALVYTTTEGMNTAIRGVGLGAGDEVLTCNLEHNAVMVPAYVSRMRDGIDVKIVRFPSQDETAASMIDAFENAMTPRTKLVLLSHVSWNRGTRLPISRICAMAHARGALVAVDAAQSAGHVDVNVRDMGCDVLALPGHKWLLGPDGAAALYVRRDLIERMQPLAVVHGANRHYDFEGNFEYANDSIHKFELTTHSGPVLAGLSAALEMFAQMGLPAVEARCLELAGRFATGLCAIQGVRVTTPLDASVRSGIITFTVRDFNPHETVAALYGLGRIVGRVCNDKRVRVCLHIFNDESDVDRTLDAIERIARRGIPAGTPSAADWSARMLEGED